MTLFPSLARCAHLVCDTHTTCCVSHSVNCSSLLVWMEEPSANPNSEWSVKTVLRPSVRACRMASCASVLNACLPLTTVTSHTMPSSACSLGPWYVSRVRALILALSGASESCLGAWCSPGVRAAGGSAPGSRCYAAARTRRRWWVACIHGRMAAGVRNTPAQKKTSKYCVGLVACGSNGNLAETPASPRGHSTCNTWFSRVSRAHLHAACHVAHPFAPTCVLMCEHHHLRTSTPPYAQVLAVGPCSGVGGGGSWAGAWWASWSSA
jgi:hypothetical protein